MSSYIAEMTIGSNTYKVLDADISYYQHTRGGGMPSSDVQGGTFTVKIESSDGPQYDMLTEWMFGKSLMKEGFIRFYKKDGISRLFDFEFYDAHCIRYHEHFNYANDQTMDTSLTISPGITRIKSLVKERPWKISEVSESELSSNLATKLSGKQTIGPTRLIFNLQWKKEGAIIDKAIVGDIVSMTADVTGINDGSSVNLQIFEKDELYEDDLITSMSTLVKDSKIEVKWKVVYTEDKDDKESAEEESKLGYTLPEYIFKASASGI
jgi:hypothetical protein